VEEAVALIDPVESGYAYDPKSRPCSESHKQWEKRPVPRPIAFCHSIISAQREVKVMRENWTVRKKLGR